MGENNYSDNNQSQVKEFVDPNIDQKYYDKQYYTEYNSWRKNKKNVHGLFIDENRKEFSYLQGYGLLTDTPTAIETKIFRNVLSIIGFCLLFYTCIDLSSSVFFPDLVAKIVPNYFYDNYTGVSYGQYWQIWFFSFFYDVIKVALPLLVFTKMLKMPPKVIFPFKIINKFSFKCVIPVMLITCTYCLILYSLYSQILYVADVRSIVRYIDVSSVPEIIAMIILNCILTPVLNVLLINGAIMQLVRQFGDGFAIIFTASISAILTYSIDQVGFAFVTSLVVGYFAIRTGSLFAAMIAKIIASLYYGGVLAITFFLSSYDIEIYAFGIALIIDFYAIIFMLINLKKMKISFGIELKQTNMAISAKIFSLITDKGMLLWATACFIIAVMRITQRYKC